LLGNRWSSSGVAIGDFQLARYLFVLCKQFWVQRTADRCHHGGPHLWSLAQERTSCRKENIANPFSVLTHFLEMQESGIDSPHGWTINNVNFDNEYYNALMGAATALTPDNEKESVSPNWVRFFEDNTGTVFPSINRWELSVAGLNINMVRQTSTFSVKAKLSTHLLCSDCRALNTVSLTQMLPWFGI
jgi:hypothetical protein